MSGSLWPDVLKHFEHAVTCQWPSLVRKTKQSIIDSFELRYIFFAFQHATEERYSNGVWSVYTQISWQRRHFVSRCWYFVVEVIQCATMLPVKVFAQWNFIADFCHLQLTVSQKCQIWVYEPRLGDLGRHRTLVDNLLQSPWSTSVHDNWTFFAISYGSGTTRRRVWNSCASDGGRSLRAQILREQNYPLPICWYPSKGNWSCYNCHWKCLCIMKLCSRLLMLHCQNSPKMKNLGIWPHFGEVCGGVGPWLIGSWKASVWLPIRDHWTSLLSSPFMELQPGGGGFWHKTPN